MISGPVEGLLLIILFSLLTYANGVSWWYQVCCSFVEYMKY
jgi:hypothetical protein